MCERIGINAEHETGADAQARQLSSVVRLQKPSELARPNFSVDRRREAGTKASI